MALFQSNSLLHSVAQRVLIGAVFFSLLPYIAIADDDIEKPVNEEVLWLPLSYQQHYPQMLEAAQNAFDDSYCEQLIEGTLNEKKSSSDHMVFTFRCRTKDKRLFTIDIDANTFQISHSLENWIKQQKIEEERERQDALRRERLRKQQEQEQYWEACYKVLARKVNLFTSPEITSALPPEPDINEVGEYIYYIEFQTLSSKNTVLQYLATASIHSLEKCDVSIRPL